MSDTFRIDTTKIQFHPHRVAQALDAQASWDLAKSVYPIYIEFSPNAHCNSRCTHCALDFTEYKKLNMDADMLKVRFKEMGELGVKSLMAAGEGEPMLHPRISDIVDYATDAGIKISFTSNGTMMNKAFVERSLSKISWIKISLNGGDHKSYSAVHRVKEAEFDKVIANIKYAVEYKREHNLNCVIGIQSVLLPENAHTMEALVLLGKELGVSYVVIKPFSPHQSMLNKQYDSMKYAEYITLAEGLSKHSTEDFEVVARLNAMKSTGHTYDKCLSTPLIWGYINSKADVLACSAHYENPRFNLGNLNDSSFKEIWQGEKRQALFEEGICIDECRKNCRMNHANIYLDQIANNKVPHVNFI